MTRPAGRFLSTRPTLFGGQILCVTLPLTRARGIAPKVLESKLTFPLSPSTQQRPFGICKISYDPGTFIQSPWSAISRLTIHWLGSSGDLKTTTSPRENRYAGADNFSMNTTSPVKEPNKSLEPGLKVGCMDWPWVRATLPIVSAKEMEITAARADRLARRRKYSPITNN